METSSLTLLDPNFQEQLYLLPSSTAIDQSVPQDAPIPQMETSSSLSLLNPDFQEQLYLLPSSIAIESDPPNDPIPQMETSSLSLLDPNFQEQLYLSHSSDESAPENDPISQMETSSHSFLNPNIQEELYLLPPPQPMINQPQGPQEDIQNQSQPKLAPTSSGSSPQPVEYSIKKTNPVLGGGQVIGGRVVNSRKASTYDLVERMQFLFVRVVKAQNLPIMDITGNLDPFVEVGVGNYTGITRFSETSNPEWNAVFAFSKESMQASILDVVVKDKDMIDDECFGIVHLDINNIPIRVPPGNPLAPEWYRMEDKKGNKVRGELMLAVWIGIQADEAFPDAAMSNADSSVSSMFLRSQVYHSPTLWYVRVNVIEVQDLVWAEETRIPDVFVKVQINNQISRTKSVKAKTANALWNEDLMFVVAEPFEDHLILIVEDRVGPGQYDVLGRIFIPLSSVERRVDDRTVRSRWFNLQKTHGYESDEEETKKDKFATRVHLRVSLDGGYHVHDESTQYSSDLRPTAKELWKPSIGILEVGILNASVLQPVKTRDGKGTADAYCVAKYGHQWVRTRTVVDNLSPRFNEQFTWEVYDMSTVITVGLFDNGQIDNENTRDARIGKIRVRISTLETGKVYTHSYPLLVLHPKGVKKMGELNLAIRFSSTSMMNMMMMYSKPLLPKMHYAKPLTLVQHEMLRHQVVGIVAARLSRVEPPLRREIVEYITDADLNLWSMRRSKENFFRVVSVFNGAHSVSKWFEKVCLWKNPTTTIIVHILFPTPVVFPELIIPTIFLCMFLIGLWNYRFGAHYPPHIKYPHEVNEDELDEEFDTFPTSRSSEYVRHRYDRLRSVAGRIQLVVGDIASQGERLLGLLSWRDPRATTIFLVFCLVAAFVVYATPFQVLVILSGFYVMRHPRFRHRYPSATLNFFRRLPPSTDNML